jgi:hypothetical protein
MPNSIRREMVKHLVASGLSQKKARKIVAKVKTVEASSTAAEVWIRNILPIVKAEDSFNKEIVVA